MKYSIKDLAELIGCTTSAIRYFEKENLITVEKEKNGHRFYDVVDVFRLLSYEKYRSMEIPMKTIVKQFGGKENDRSIIQKREEYYKNEALKKAEYYRDLADSIENHLVGIRRIDTLLDKYELAQSPEMVVICDEECGWVSRNRKSQRTLHEWVKAMPEVQLAVLHKNLELSDFGYLVEPKSREKLALPLALKNEILPSASCLHTVVMAEDDFMEQPQKVFEKAMEYAQSKGLEVGKTAWGKILLVEVGEQERLKTYVEIWISIKI